MSVKDFFWRMTGGPERARDFYFLCRDIQKLRRMISELRGKVRSLESRISRLEGQPQDEKSILDKWERKKRELEKRAAP